MQERSYRLPDYRSTPGNRRAYTLRRMDGDTAHFLMITFLESEEAIRAFAGDDISVAKYYDFDKNLSARTGAVFHALRDVRTIKSAKFRFLT